MLPFFAIGFCMLLVSKGVDATDRKMRSSFCFQKSMKIASRGGGMPEHWKHFTKSTSNEGDISPIPSSKLDLFATFFKSIHNEDRPISQETERKQGDLPKTTIFKQCLRFLLLASPLEEILWKMGFSTDRGLLKSLSRWCATGIYLIVMTSIMGTYGFDTKPLIAGFGFTSFLAGFALKELVTNILSGALLVIQRPFRVGWTIKVSSFRGKVLAIDTRYVRLETDEGYHVLIPSYTVFSSPVIIEHIPGQLPKY